MSEERERTLRVADRGDCCGAQAFVKVTIESRVPGIAATDLLLCGHHYAEHEAYIVSQGYAVVDERWAINEKPSPSAFGDNTGDFDAKKGVR